MTPEQILARIRLEGTPLVEEGQAVFVWQGDNPPLLMGDFSNWEWGQPVELEPAAPGLWTYRLSLPADTYMEYVYFRGDKRYQDPYNRRKTPNGVGKINHYFYMPAGQPNPFTKERGKLHGQISRHVLKATRFVYRDERLVYLYQPPVEQACPLLVVYDGRDYLRRAYLALMVERMIAAGRLSPVAIAFVQNGGTARMMEYSANDTTLNFITGFVLPLAQERLNILNIDQHPGAYGVLGASMGGLMALYTGLRLPRIFGRVLSQSGAFSTPYSDFVVFDLVEHGPVRPIDIWMEVGVYDFDWLIPANQRMSALLQQKGYRVRYREYNAGHNYPAWRDEVWRGLEYLFPMDH